MKKALFLGMVLCLVCTSAFASDLSQATQYPASMYKVGADLPAGEYLAVANPNPIIPMVTVRDGSSTDANILRLATFSTFSIIGVKDGEYISVSDSFLVGLDDALDYITSSTTDGISDGSYKVGTHIPAGEYKYTAKEGGIMPMITVYADAYQENILDVKIVEGSGYITLSDGQYIVISDATLSK